jgi:radical SAM protein with 4Fe4S-binding SPASM domain
MKIKTIETRRIKIDADNKFVSIFNTDTGTYIRSGIINPEGRDTGVDPFMSSGPELIDIGIMNRCLNANRCTVGCYQGKRSQGENMSLEDYKLIMEQAKDFVFQVALGGAGSPDEHPQFREILQATREVGIVPNYTTSGIGVTKEIAQITKEFCGACAVSMYDQPYTYKAIELFLGAGCKTNIHYVLSNSSIDNAIRRLEADDFPKGINAVIFLTHKPVGCGEIGDVLKVDDRLHRFMELVNKAHPYKIGFDSCMVPGIINYGGTNILRQSIDTCEGARYSCYITSDMIMVPCSFDQAKIYGVSLRDHTIKEAWNSEPFTQFREHFQHSCPGCKDQADCMGGCPIIPSITLCNRSEKQRSTTHHLDPTGLEVGACSPS